jgi:hypothetical protein
MFLSLERSPVFVVDRSNLRVCACARHSSIRRGLAGWAFRAEEILGQFDLNDINNDGFLI